MHLDQARAKSCPPLARMAASHMSARKAQSLACICRGDVWRHLFGAYTVWLDTKPEEDAATAPQREAYGQAEVYVRIGSTRAGEAAGVAEAGAASAAGAAGEAGEVAPGSLHLTDDLVDGVVSQVLPGLLEAVDKEPGLPQAKLLYIKLGCRGDWPMIMPPEWTPGES